MKCPNCGEEMVDGEFRVKAEWKPFRQSGAWARPTGVDAWDEFLMRDPGTRVNDQRMTVCYRCGAMVVFVEDPSIFRPKTGTETLPGPASAQESPTETLPRPTGEAASHE